MNADLIWGVSALSHDASLSVVRGSIIEFASHSERYSRVKNDPTLAPDLINEALQYGVPDLVAWYERPLIKKLRHTRARQWRHASALTDLPGRYLRSIGVKKPAHGIVFIRHHDAHAYFACASSGFSPTAFVVADSIGEFRTFSLGTYDIKTGLQELYALDYPHSLGLLYSAFTRRCGFRPNEDEYIVMGMAAYGRPRYVPDILSELVELRPPGFRLRFNPHRGIGMWRPQANVADLAASIQAVTETIMSEAAAWLHGRTGLDSLVLGGGVALNCVANSAVATSAGFRHVWVPPNPGDAGSSLGAAIGVSPTSVGWSTPYLGHDIPGAYPSDAALAELLTTGVVGVASGRAEFGPRALGNRSLLADPRHPSMQSRLNEIKGREPFRPFAPVVRAERAASLFDIPNAATATYMQYVVKCRRPEDYPGVVHVDNTSRVQTVTSTQHGGLYDLLQKWEDRTGCPILVNTSLNVRGEPLVNTHADGQRFSAETGVVVVG